MRPPDGLRVLLLGSDGFTSPHLRRLRRMLGRGRIAGLELMTAGAGRCDARATARELSVPEHAWRPDFDFRRFDIGVVASFGRFIPAGVIAQWPRGAINVHPSLLPRWRGSAPVLYAILAGDSVTGVSITEVSPDGFDRGVVLLQRRLPLAGHEATPELLARLAALGCDCLEATLEDLPAARRGAVGQADLPFQRSLARRPDPSFACLDWERMDASAVDRLARGMGPLAPLRCRLEFGSARQQRSLIVPVSLSGHVPPAECESLLRRLGPGPHPSSERPGQLLFAPLAPEALFVGCAGGGWAGFRCLTRGGNPRTGPVDFYNGYLSGRDCWARLIGQPNGFFASAAGRSSGTAAAAPLSML